MYKVTYAMVAPSLPPSALDPRVVVPDLQDKCGRRKRTTCSAGSRVFGRRQNCCDRVAMKSFDSSYRTGLKIGP